MTKLLIGFAAGTFYGVIVSVKLPELPLSIIKFVLHAILKSMGE